MITEPASDKTNFKQSSYELLDPNTILHYYEYFGDKVICQAWPSSFFFTDLFNHIPVLVNKKRVLDLGCGIGLAGIVRLIVVYYLTLKKAALRNGAEHVTFSDYSPTEITQALIEKNSGSIEYIKKFDVIQCDWRKPFGAIEGLKQGKFDVVVAGDCLYEREAYNSLFGLISLMFTWNEALEVYMTYQERGNADPILMHFKKFKLKFVDMKLPPDFAEDLALKYAQMISPWID